MLEPRRNYPVCDTCFAPVQVVAHELLTEPSKAPLYAIASLVSPALYVLPFLFFLAQDEIPSQVFLGGELPPSACARARSWLLYPSSPTLSRLGLIVWRALDPILISLFEVLLVPFAGAQSQFIFLWAPTFAIFQALLPILRPLSTDALLRLFSASAPLPVAWVDTLSASVWAWLGLLTTWVSLWDTWNLGFRFQSLIWNFKSLLLFCVKF